MPIANIEIIDSGKEKYTLMPKDMLLGRLYDNEAETIKIVKPAAEKDSICTMIITDINGSVLDHVVIKEDTYTITSAISTKNRVKIGFSFSRADGYIKGSEIVFGKFLPAPKPDGFVPVEPEQKKNIDYLVSYGFTNSKLVGNELQFFNMNGDKVVSFDLSPFTQEQSDLGETDVSRETFVKGKKTSNLKNDGEDGSSPYATQEWALNKQNYAIVDEEPTDKSQGKMIYQKSEANALGKATIDKINGKEGYSSPSGVLERLREGTATVSDLENYYYMLREENGYVRGYINLGSLNQLSGTGSALNSINLLYRVNGGGEQTDTLRKTTTTGTKRYVGTKFTVILTQELDNSKNIPDNYFTASIENQTAFAVATTDTIQITKLKLGPMYIDIAKGGSGGDAPFQINNLKIADGNQYNTLKQLINEGMQKKLTAGTGITIENNVISATAQETQIDNTTITKTVDGKLQAIGLQDETDSKTLTAHDIWLACSIEREV